jgi:hypothetical protein
MQNVTKTSSYKLTLCFNLTLRYYHNVGLIFRSVLRHSSAVIVIIRVFGRSRSNDSSAPLPNEGVSCFSCKDSSAPLPNEGVSCFSSIYCYGDLLKTVQLADIYNDSKTFVDKKQRQPPTETLQLFDDFMAKTGGNPDRDQVQGLLKYLIEIRVR